jgi:hypothetical protein
MKKALILSLLFLFAAPVFAGEVLIPAVFRGPGANNTSWRTEIVVSNITSDPQLEPVETTITFHGSDDSTHSVTMPLSRMEVIAVPDAVREWFDVENGGGIVRVTWDGSAARIVARARIYNLGEHGQYGQNVPGIETSKLLSENYLPGLTGVDGNRTNVGISNPTTTTALVWVELIDTSGLSRGAFTTVVKPRSYIQINDIFDSFQAGPLSAAMVRISSSNTIVYSYASIVRNDTGDASFVVGQ